MLIYLVGFMGSGKSTTGRKLAYDLGFAFYDLDRMIEDIYKISIPGIFCKYDENTFRKLEHETLVKTFQFRDTVIATGGGAPCFYGNMDLINTKGISVYLEMSPAALASRLRHSRKKRPLLFGNEQDLIYHIEKMMAGRKSFYEMAQITVSGIDLDISRLKENILHLNKDNTKTY